MAEKRFFYSKRVPAAAAGSPPDAPELSIQEKLLAILRSGPLVNGAVALAVAVGFFHGWLKVEIPHPATTFFFDAILCAALFLVFFQQKRNDYFIPPGPLGRALKGFYVVCGVYLFLPLPESPPFLISLAAARGWCFASLMFTLGYRLTRSVAQVKGYLYLVIFLGLFTAIYGILQDPKAVEKQMDEDAYFAERHQNTYFKTSTGRQFRHFSTFVSSGAFGGTLAYVAVFALILLTDPRCPKMERVLLAVVLAPVSYGIVLSGARSALISMGCGFVVIAWHRRNFVNFILIPAALVVLFKIGGDLTGGTVTERYSTLLKFEEIWTRQTIPTSIGWDYMMDHLIGGGMGKSGHSVPAFLSNVVRYHDYVNADGDMGRLMIDMGIFGLIFFGGLIWTALRLVYVKLKAFQGTPVSAVALASAVCMVMAVVTLPSGSPFLGVPVGALVWFFTGMFFKLADEQKQGTLAGAESPPETRAKRFGYIRQPRERGPSGTATEAS